MCSLKSNLLALAHQRYRRRRFEAELIPSGADPLTMQTINAFNIEQLRGYLIDATDRSLSGQARAVRVLSRRPAPEMAAIVLAVKEATAEYPPEERDRLFRALSAFLERTVKESDAVNEKENQ